MNHQTNTLAVFAPGGALAGLVEVWDNEPHVRHYIYATTHPGHQGRGIGSLLAGWAEARGRGLLPLAPERARVILRQFKLSSDSAAAQLLIDAGYALTRHNLRMTIDLPEPPAPPIVPAGLVIRPLAPDAELRHFVAAVREEFRDHWGHVEMPFEQEVGEWQHWMATSPTCDPSLFFVAVDGEEIAGTSVCQDQWVEDDQAGWITALGVRRPWRRRGLALALLQHSFVALYERGKRRACLGVDADSLTGATRLYEKAGMRVDRQYDFYEKELRPGEDLSTRELA
jgi:ribosomal protein S18 acetylase RimI-like enzyme